MKKTLVVFVIFAALLVLFTISCSAASVEDVYVTYNVNLPVNVNLYQPHYENAYYRDDLDIYGVTVTAKLPNNASNSALGVILPYSLPNNNTLKVSGDFRFTSAMPTYEEVIVPVSFFGSANSTKPLSSSFLHFVFDFGGSLNTAGRATSQAIKDHIYIMYRGNHYPFSWSGNLAFCDVPVQYGTTANEFGLYIDARTFNGNTWPTYFMLINYAWIYQNDTPTSQAFFNYENFSLGYNTAYYFNQSVVTDGNVSDEYIQTVAEYWYTMGYNQGIADVGNDTYNQGYQDGVSSVTDEYGDPVNIRTLVLTIPDALVSLLRSLFDYNVVGINLFSIFKFILALLAVVFVVRLVMRSLI